MLGLQRIHPKFITISVFSHNNWTKKDTRSLKVWWKWKNTLIKANLRIYFFKEWIFCQNNFHKYVLSHMGWWSSCLKTRAPRCLLAAASLWLLAASIFRVHWHVLLRLEGRNLKRILWKTSFNCHKLSITNFTINFFFFLISMPSYFSFIHII